MKKLIEKIENYIEQEKRLSEKGHNPWHGVQGRFTDQDEAESFSATAWDSNISDEEKAEVEGGEVASPATKPCGREARRKAGDIRCKDGKVIDEPSGGVEGTY